MVGKRQLRARCREENVTETENSDASSKRQKTRQQNSRKAVSETSDLKSSLCITNDCLKTPLAAVDKNKSKNKIKDKQERKVEDIVSKSKECDEKDLCVPAGKSDGCEKVNQSQCSLDKSCTKDAFLEDLLRHGLHERSVKPEIKKVRKPLETSKNLIHVLQQFSYGTKCRVQVQEAVKSPVVDLTKDFELYRNASPFDRRVTAMEWHPTKPSILAVGSKGGDIILWDTDSINKDKFVHGIGAAGSCQAIKFWPWDTDKIVSASINGTVTLHDFETQTGTVLADTMDSYDHWYCSVDVNPGRYLVVAGRNGGILHMMSTEGRKVFEYRLHKNKITHVEFSPREEWLLCTASTDQTVQMWDVRYMKDRKSCLQVLRHDKPVNSAYFSHTDGCRLLTTDQNKEIRMYRAPFWQLETTIEHPHRFFQHISPFKASWHPFEDLIVCGRYPDKSTAGSTGLELRTIDIFDADTGKIVSQLYSQGTDGLCPLNKFNRQGDALASGMGFHILLWNRKLETTRKQSLLLGEMERSMPLSGTCNLASGSANSDHRSRPRPRQQKKRKTEEDMDDLKKKMKTKTKEKTETTEIKKNLKKKK